MLQLAIYFYFLDRTKLDCDGALKIRPNESKILRSPYFYSHVWQKVKRKCIWRLCPSRGWRVMVKMMIVHITFSSNRFATWHTLNNKQKPALSMGLYDYSFYLQHSYSPSMEGVEGHGNTNFVL